MRRTLIFGFLFYLGSIGLSAQNYGLQYYDQANSYPGYTLYSMGFETQLIDNCGHAIHTWNTDNIASLTSYLMPNGNLLFPSRLSANTTFDAGGGGGGRIDIYNQNSQLVWRYDYHAPNDYCAHHDVEPLPNGNFLLIAWEEIPSVTLLSLGRNPASTVVNFWSERVVEIEPIGINQINVVWEWHMVDHLIQNYSTGLPNYGEPSDHPNRMDINVEPTATDWLHMNGVEYIEEFDQILVSFRKTSEIMVIDHSTTTAEAATSSGGSAGKGGDILWRYGNPEVYGRGSSADKVLNFQHDAKWIPLSSPSIDAGRITVFNNFGGQNIGAGNTSTAEVIDPPVDAFGNWTQPSGTAPFLPSNPTRIYSNGPGLGGTFFSSNQGGVHALPNGNIMVCNANTKQLFELDQNDNIVWEYRMPIEAPIFKSYRYKPTDIELSTFSLVPGPTVEFPSAAASSGCTVTYPCAISMSLNGLPSSTSSTSAITLTGSPAGGTFSGLGMISNTFNPAIAGAGLHDITYTYTDGNGCTDSVTESIFIFTIAYNFTSYSLGTISPKNSLEIDITSAEPAELNIQFISLDGKIIEYETLEVLEGHSEYDINISDLPAGAYIIHLFNDDIQSSRKFIKQE